MLPLPTSSVAAGGLVGGFAVARATERRDVGGALFAGAGLWCLWSWRERSGARAAAALGAGYVVAMGVSHPLAKKMGAWPAVLAVAAAVAGASELVTRRGSPG